MKLFLHELRMSWKVALWVNIGTIVLLIVGVIKYTGFASDPTANTNLLAQFPKVVFAVLGMGDLDLGTVSGFYGVLFFYVILIGAAYATSLGINCIAREENEQTIEFLLVKPIARWHILAVKLAVALFWISIFIVASAIATLIGLQLIEVTQDITSQVWLASASLIPRFIIYIGTGLLTATFLNKATTGGLIGYSFYAISWLLSIFYLMFTQLAWFRFLTPFQFYQIQDLLHLGWSWSMTLYSVGLIITLLTFGFWRYQTTDVRVH